jgi:SAM-dependent methyltransferase
MTVKPQSPSPPLPWITRHAGLIPKTGPVLDLACGQGRHSRLLLELGYPVVAVDRNLEGVADLQNQQGIDLIEADLEADLESDSWPFPAEHFAGIVVSHYLYRPNLPRLITSMRTGGILIYETFAAGNEKFGRPRNPDYLLHENELRDYFAQTYAVIAFEQGEFAAPEPACKQRYCGRRKTTVSLSTAD